MTQLKPATFKFQNPHDPREELMVELCEYQSFITLIRDGYGRHRMGAESMTKEQLKALLTMMRDSKKYQKKFLCRRKSSLDQLIQKCLGCGWETSLKLRDMFNLV